MAVVESAEREVVPEFGVPLRSVSGQSVNIQFISVYVCMVDVRSHVRRRNRI